MKIRPSDVSKWILADGDNTYRLEYPLNKNSTVIDLGGAVGAWSMPIYNLYKPNIYIFEPTNLFTELQNRFDGFPKVHLLNFAAANEDVELVLGVMDGEASVFHEDNLVKVQGKNFGAFLESLQASTIDLLKMNVEGAEYDILEGIISRNQLDKFVNIQCQFHMIENYNERYEKLVFELKKTHYLTWRFPFVWENWTKKGYKPPRMSRSAKFRKSSLEFRTVVARALGR